MTIIVTQASVGVNDEDDSPIIDRDTEIRNTTYGIIGGGGDTSPHRSTQSSGVHLAYTDQTKAHTEIPFSGGNDLTGDVEMGRQRSVSQQSAEYAALAVTSGHGLLTLCNDENDDQMISQADVAEHVFSMRNVRY